MLLPSDEPEEFLRRPRCNAAIERTNRCKALLGGSLHREFLVETHADVRELLSAGEFTVTAIRTEKK